MAVPLYQRVIRRLCCLRLQRGGGLAGAGGKTLYLTFDDGPHELHTPQVLDLLQRFDAKATFFVVGDALARHGAIGRRMVAEGHLLANHSYSHLLSPGLGRRQFATELARCQQEIELLQPGSPWLFRPPAGLLGLGNLLVLAGSGYSPCLWTIDSGDSAHPTPQAMAELLTREVSGNAVLLFHDDAELCTRTLALLLPRWQAQGYAFKTLAPPGWRPRGVSAP